MRRVRTRYRAVIQSTTGGAAGRSVHALAGVRIALVRYPSAKERKRPMRRGAHLVRDKHVKVAVVLVFIAFLLALGSAGLAPARAQEGAPPRRGPPGPRPRARPPGTTPARRFRRLRCSPGRSWMARPDCTLTERTLTSNSRL